MSLLGPVYSPKKLISSQYSNVNFLTNIIPHIDIYCNSCQNGSIPRNSGIIVCEPRLMNGSSRIAVAELLPFRDWRPESWRSRFPRACRNEVEILLAFVQDRQSTPIDLGLCCQSIHPIACGGVYAGARRYPVSSWKYPRASVIGWTKAKSGCRSGLLQVAVLQLQRRQGQVRHQRCRQCQ